MKKKYALICNKRIEMGGSSDIMRFFEGNSDELIKYIKKVNSGNYSYRIIDFKKVQ